MKKMMLFAGLVAACAVQAQYYQQPQAVVQQPQAVVQQPVQQVTTTTVVPAPAVVTPAPPPPPPPPVVVSPPGYQPCPRCGGRGKEEHALGFKTKRCKLCHGKGFLPPPPPPPVHHHHRRY